jgi:hypothetical protein
VFELTLGAFLGTALSLLIFGLVRR